MKALNDKLEEAKLEVGACFSPSSSSPPAYPCSLLQIVRIQTEIQQAQGKGPPSGQTATAAV